MPLLEGTVEIQASPGVRNWPEQHQKLAQVRVVWGRIKNTHRARLGVLEWSRKSSPKLEEVENEERNRSATFGRHARASSRRAADRHHVAGPTGRNLELNRN